MSAFAQEYDMAKREGVRFLFHARPVAFSGQHHVEGVKCESGTYIKCDTVIIAIGQLRLLETLERVAGIELIGGLVDVVPETGQTANPKYFAGGDCVNGGREVVDAVAAGKRAARGIQEWLT
jgi:glutamate synthase (NADPH/NADH) small chain